MFFKLQGCKKYAKRYSKIMLCFNSLHCKMYSVQFNLEKIFIYV